MPRLQWGRPESGFADGVSHGVIYSGTEVETWDGLLAVNEKASGSVSTYYVDGVAKLVAEEIGDFEATIEAYTYPDAFEKHTGYGEQPSYERFDLSYRTLHASGYRLNLVYNALARPNDKSYTTASNPASPSSFAWDIQSTDTDLTAARPAAHLVIDSLGYLGVTKDIEDILYGTDTTEPRMPRPSEVVEIFESATSLRIKQNRDGTWTATGSEDYIQVLPDGSFSITSPSALYYDSDRYVINSY